MTRRWVEGRIEEERGAKAVMVVVVVAEPLIEVVSLLAGLEVPPLVGVEVPPLVELAL